MKEKDYTQAVEAYKQALRNDPTDEETRYNYAYAKQKLKENPPKNDQNKDKNKDKDKDKDKNKDKNKDNNKDKDKDKKDDKGDQDKDKKTVKTILRKMTNLTIKDSQNHSLEEYQKSVFKIY